MGYALAAVAARRGASVCLVTTVRRPLPPGAVEEVRVETAAEMAEAVAARFPKLDVVVMAAAVADYGPRCPPPPN